MEAVVRWVFPRETVTLQLLNEHLDFECVHTTRLNWNTVMKR